MSARVYRPCDLPCARCAPARSACGWQAPHLKAPFCICALAWFGIGLLACPALAQSPNGGTRLAKAALAAAPPVIDGRLDDAVWAAAPPIGGFLQREPYEGRPASQPTEVRVLYDADALYIGAWLYDSAPAGIVVGEARRDADLADTDAFLLVLDTYRDRQNGFVFGTNPAGIEYDGQVTREGEGGGAPRQRQQVGSGGGFNKNWDGSWEVATAVDSAGWYAEFRIPFATLRYAGAGRQEWGVNFARHLRRLNEQAFWSPVPRQYGLPRVSLAGLLALEVPARHTLHVTPYLLGSAQRDFAGGAGTEFPFEAGADAKVGITSGLALDLTYNTDFAQVEVDEQQVNLTRFSLFFPEKRPFFLENAGLFSVGSSEAVELFFSRRIGIAGERSVPIVAGGRLTGRLGATRIGVLNIQTEALDTIQPANNYTVARLLRELPNRSRLGALLVNRMATGEEGDWNRTWGVDGRLGIGQAVTLDAWAGGTSTPGVEGREHAFGIGGEYTTRDWRGTVAYREVGESFHPDVGFLSRSGYRFYEVFALRHLRFAGVPWLRELRPHISWRAHFDLAGFQESGTLHLDNHIALANGAFFSPAFNLEREGLKEPFRIAPGVRVPPGTYDNWTAAWRFNTNESAALSLNGSLDAGGFLSGRRRAGNVTLTARGGARWAAALRLSRNRVELPEGSFSVDLVRLRLAYTFGPRIYLQGLTQYNSQQHVLSSNLRFGWLGTAGTGLFLVYNENRRTGGNAALLDRAFFLKFTRQFELR